MNVKNILSEIEQTDPEIYEQVTGRRDVLKSFGSKVALASLPFAIGSLFSNKAYGKSTDVISDVFNFALQIKYLQYNFYHMGNNTGALIPVSDLAGFQTIEAQEAAQIGFLKTTVTGLGGVPFTPNHYNPAALNPLFVPDGYDFTAGGTYSPFDNYKVFLQLAQVFEDCGVHAIKGQMSTVLGNAPALAQVMQLQCAEARHAAHVRVVRRFIGSPENPAPWITNNIPPTIALQPFYVGEDNTTQNGVNIMNLEDQWDNSGTVPKISATAAFDESMDKPTVLSLLAPFML